MTKKIGDGAAGAATGATDKFEVSQGGATQLYATAAQIKTFCSASPTLVTPALGTPSSGTLTNCTALPVAGITASTVTALGVGSVELGHASDTTLARVSAGVVSIEGSNVIMASNTGTTGHVLGYLDGANFWSAGQSYSAGIVVTAGGMSLTQSNAGFEIGAVASSNTPFIDFHSSASSTDYDVRMIASGGTASAGAGTLTITAASIALGAATFTGPIIGSNYTIATLPTATAYSQAYVSDSLAVGAFGATLTAGGSVKIPVYADGAAWRYG